MNEIQMQLFSMYEDVKKILDSHGITFYIQFGTAIGAVRHDGFIPWDDDIDLLVWEEDLDKVNKVLSEELDDFRYYYHIPSADTHPHVIMKGSDTEMELKNKESPFIDIFPLSRYPSKNVRKILFNAMVWGNVGSIWAIDHVNSASLHRVLEWIPRVFKKIADKLIDEKSDLTVIYATEFKGYIFPRDWYGEPVMHRFETSEAPLPKNYDEMLTSMYGDYMTPPPEDSRKGAGGFPCGAYIDYLRDKKK